LYDLARDPLETENLYDPDDPRVRDLLERYREVAARIGADEPPETRPAPLTAEDEARLRSLGYLGSRGAPGRAEKRNPRDSLPILYATLELNDALAAGEHERVAREARGLLAEDPGNPHLVELLTNSLAEMGERERAVSRLRKFLEKYPGHPSLRASLGWFHYQGKEYARALEIWESLWRAGRVDPQLFECLARVHLKKWEGRPADPEAAVRSAERAVDLGSTRYDLLAAAYLAAERPGDCVTILEENLPRMPDGSSGAVELLQRCREAVPEE
jgi:tetratricopeptide (TPR) repeat protein